MLTNTIDNPRTTSNVRLGVIRQMNYDHLFKDLKLEMCWRGSVSYSELREIEKSYSDKQKGS